MRMLTPIQPFPTLRVLILLALLHTLLDLLHNKYGADAHANAIPPLPTQQVLLYILCVRILLYICVRALVRRICVCILVRCACQRYCAPSHAAGTHFTCFTGTKVQFTLFRQLPRCMTAQ